MSKEEMQGLQIHEKAICESSSIGENTRIWAFAHILSGAIIGENCNICDGAFIENDVVVGNNVTIKCGVQLWDGIRIADDVFIGPNATFTNDKFPRSKEYPDEFLTTTVESHASIGANATILPGITIGTGAMVGAGSVVTKNIPPGAIVQGNPARIVGYTNSQKIDPVTNVDDAPSKSLLTVRNCFTQSITKVNDIRGDLVAMEISKDLPFNPQRAFMVFNVPGEEVRGEHAHFECEQFLLCIQGSISCLLDDGENKVEVTLNSPTVGLYIAPRTWGVQYKYSPDAILWVFASHAYDSSDYIRDYNTYLELANKAPQS